MSGRETDGKGQRLEGARGGRLAFSLPLPQSVSPRHTHTHTRTRTHTHAHTHQPNSLQSCLPLVVPGGTLGPFVPGRVGSRCLLVVCICEVLCGPGVCRYLEASYLLSCLSGCVFGLPSWLKR